MFAGIRARMSFFSFGYVVFVGSLLLVLGVRADGQDQKAAEPSSSSPRLVHFVLCGLTKDDNIGDAIGVSLHDLEQVLRAEVAREYVGSFQVLKDNDCNAKKILDTVHAVSLSKNDTLYLYYAGHGGYDPTLAGGDPSGGHHFQIPSGDLMRKTLFEQMQGKEARLTVLISDTCNVRSYFRAKTMAEQRVKSFTFRGSTPLEMLLLLNRGIVDISASSRDQYSWFSSESGGWFSSVLCVDLPRHDDWKSLFEQLSKDSDNNYREKRQRILDNPGQADAETLDQLRGQEHMIPQAFHLDIQHDGPEQLTDRERTIERVHTTRKAVR
jgi:hypothetical protein